MNASTTSASSHQGGQGGGRLGYGLAAGYLVGTSDRIHKGLKPPVGPLISISPPPSIWHLMEYLLASYKVR